MTVDIFHLLVANLIDGVFLPQTEEQPIYFVEVQFQPDTEIYSRLFAEINLYLRQNQQMFGLSDLKQTRVYQQAFAEGERKAKLKTVPRFLALGLTVEQIAQELDLTVEEVS